MEDLTGKQLGQYRVIGPLGEGGMAAVYKAYDPVLDRYVALKVLARHFTRDPQFTGRFQREAKLIAKLQHVHILPVYDYGQEDDYTFIVMPFIQTGTLADLLDDHALPLEQILRIITQVGDALAYAHERGIVHRDVKPSNILIDDRGNCLLTDFGIAKIVEATMQFTQTGAVIGTPSYMSPEQILGEHLDGRSDLYSLGIILFELATGRRPYRAETPPAIFVKHLHDPLPMPRDLNPDIPEAMQRVILKSLAKNREHRYPTAGALVQALSEAIRETGPASAESRQTEIEGGPYVPTPAADLTPPQPARAEKGERLQPPGPKAASRPRPGMRGRGWILGGVGALVGVAVVAGVGLLAINALTGQTARFEPTSPPAPQVPPTSSATQVASPSSPAPAAGETQRRSGLIVFHSTNRVGPTGSDIWTIDPEEPQSLQQLTDTLDQDFGPRWSPDHSQAVFTRYRESDNTMSLWLVNWDGTSERQISPWWQRGTGGLSARFWHPDGTRVYYILAPGGGPCSFQWISAEGPLDQPANPVIGAGHKCQPDISPDGRSVVFMDYGSGGDLEIADLSADGTSVSNIRVLVPLDPTQFELSEPAWSADGRFVAFAMDPGGYRASIYVVGRDGSGLRLLAGSAELHLVSARWSPNDAQLAVAVDLHRTSQPRTDIWTVSFTAGELVELTSDAIPDGAPDW